MDGESLSIPESAKAAVQEETEKTFALIGQQIRKTRQRRRITIQQLADASGISASMLSLVERGMTSPSLLSLTAIGRNLGLTLAEMMSGELQEPPEEAVTRVQNMPLIKTPDGILRRILRQDRKRGVTITYNEYGSGIGNSPVGITHTGFEYGLVIEGELTIEIDGIQTVLHSGDVVSLRSTRVHKIWNYSASKATTVWFNLDEAES
ncbi:helix-turn-helix domain-containing protein [Devosia sediminis]|uniref:Helix-turn-helix domain-containing protein n=1 Tax=Devosia sediminis TaxID=2798801 RepID=A0A934MKC5_9HYPH|nr:helix-turn-helix domain-containing protein [Devosia sediminis]MBJ3784998.1 helix-turn-helix domain-containing protein [Devosia sediminis]